MPPFLARKLIDSLSGASVAGMREATIAMVVRQETIRLTRRDDNTRKESRWPRTRLRSVRRVGSVLPKR